MNRSPVSDDGYLRAPCSLFVFSAPSRIFSDEALFHLEALFLQPLQPDSLRILTRTVGPAKEFSYFVGSHYCRPLSSHRPHWPGGQRGQLVTRLDRFSYVSALIRDLALDYGVGSDAAHEASPSFPAGLLCVDILWLP